MEREKDTFYSIISTLVPDQSRVIILHICTYPALLVFWFGFYYYFSVALHPEEGYVGRYVWAIPTQHAILLMV